MGERVWPGISGASPVWQATNGDSGPEGAHALLQQARVWICELTVWTEDGRKTGEYFKLESQETSIMGLAMQVGKSILWAEGEDHRRCAVRFFSAQFFVLIRYC